MNCGPLTAALFRVWFTSFTARIACCHACVGEGPVNTRASRSSPGTAPPLAPTSRTRTKTPSFFCCCPDSSLCCPRFSAAFFPSSAPPSAPPEMSVSLWTLLSYHVRSPGATALLYLRRDTNPTGRTYEELELARALRARSISPRATMTTAPATKGSARRGEGGSSAATPPRESGPPAAPPARPARAAAASSAIAAAAVADSFRRRGRAPTPGRVPRSVSGRRSGGSGGGVFLGVASRRRVDASSESSEDSDSAFVSEPESRSVGGGAERSSSSSDPDDASSDARRPTPSVRFAPPPGRGRAEPSSFASVAARFASSSSKEGNRYLGGFLRGGSFRGTASERLVPASRRASRASLLRTALAAFFISARRWRGGGAGARSTGRGRGGSAGGAARALLFFARSSFSSFSSGEGKGALPGRRSPHGGADDEGWPSRSARRAGRGSDAKRRSKWVCAATNRVPSGGAGAGAGAARGPRRFGRGRGVRRRRGKGRGREGEGGRATSAWAEASPRARIRRGAPPREAGRGARRSPPRASRARRGLRAPRGGREEARRVRGPARARGEGGANARAEIPRVHRNRYAGRTAAPRDARVGVAGARAGLPSPSRRRAPPRG